MTLLRLVDSMRLATFTVSPAAQAPALVTLHVGPALALWSALVNVGQGQAAQRGRHTTTHHSAGKEAASSVPLICLCRYKYVQTMALTKEAVSGIGVAHHAGNNRPRVEAGPDADAPAPLRRLLKGILRQGRTRGDNHKQVAQLGC